MKCAKIKYRASLPQPPDIANFKANKKNPLNSFEPQISALLNAAAGKSSRLREANFKNISAQEYQ